MTLNAYKEKVEMEMNMTRMINEFKEKYGAALTKIEYVSFIDGMKPEVKLTFEL